MIQSCSGSWQEGDNDEEHAVPHVGFDNCGFAAQRRGFATHSLQSGHPSRAFGPKFLIMQALFQLHEADAGLRRQTAIAKCRLWADPIHTKSVHVKWPAKLASTPTAESSGQASGRCRSGARSVMPRARNT